MASTKVSAAAACRCGCPAKLERVEDDWRMRCSRPDCWIGPLRPTRQLAERAWQGLFGAPTCAPPPLTPRQAEVLRWIEIETSDSREGMTLRAIATRFGIGVSSAHNLVCRLRELGALVPQPAGRQASIYPARRTLA